MLDLLPLPITWLLFFAVGHVPRGRAITFRRYLAAGVSLAVLLFAVGWETAAFYGGVGLSAILLGLWLAAAKETPWRRLVFVAAILATVALIAAFLAVGTYFKKYFTYLPSLSYLGFRIIAHLVSSYQKRNVDLSSGLMQMFFFPMLFMGPISRVENFLEKKTDYHAALRRLAVGLAMLIAGRLIGAYVLTDILRLTDVPAWRYWLGMLANALEFYLVFAGYTHLVIGLGLLAGFKLPENFNNPYVSTSISDFWRRWHMSLSYWVRDYLYIPLGGNRKGLPRKCLNLIIAMGVMGIWHGLDLNYLCWGLCHGGLLAAESVLAHYNLSPVKRLVGQRAYRPAKVLMTFAVVSFLWLLFRYPVPEFAAYVRGMLSW